MSSSLRKALPLSLTLCIIGACKGTDKDSGLPVLENQGFTSAELSPAFKHSNAVWAGVALLDFDQDGWLDIFLTNGRNHFDALYQNQGDGTFIDVAQQAGVASLEETGSVVSGDIDNDGDPDLIVARECSVGNMSKKGTLYLDGGKSVYFNQGDGTFTEQILEELIAQLPMAACTTSLELFDADLDGDLDLFFINGGDPDVETPWQFRKNTQKYTFNWVLFNDGTGTFSDPTELSPDTDDDSRISFAMASFDVNGDQINDLLVGDAGFSIAQLISNGDGSWNWDQTANLSTGDGLWMGLAVADYDHDGDMDMYGTNQGLSTFIAGYDNIGKIKLRFEDEGEYINIHHSLLRNEGGQFVADSTWSVDAEQVLAGDLFDGMDGELDEYTNPTGTARYPWGWGAVPIDYDSDGWVDVAFIGNNCSMPLDVIWDEEHGAGPGALLRNIEGTGFKDVTWEAGVANVDTLGRYQDGRGVAMGDLNNDGHPDLVYANRSYNPTISDPLAQILGEPLVRVSEDRDNHWLQIELEGTVSNRDGIGSAVRVIAEDEEWFFVHGAGGGTNSSSERVVFAGLGQVEEVDIEVRFPSGIVVRENSVAADQRIRIIEE